MYKFCVNIGFPFTQVSTAQGCWGPVLMCTWFLANCETFKVLVSTLHSLQQRTRGSVCFLTFPAFPFKVILVGLGRHFV